MTSTTGHGTWMLVAIAATLLAGGCGASNGSSDTMAVTPEETTPDVDRPIEESDLYKIAGDLLYVQNPTTGLNVIDVGNPDDPVVVGRLDELTGVGGELYVQEDGRVLVVFKESDPACQLPPEMGSFMIATTSQLSVVLEASTAEPKIAGTYCMPGNMVSSRIVGDILYIVTTYTAFSDSRTWLFSVDVSDPYNIELVDYRVLEGEGYEIHVTERTIYIAQQTTDDPEFWDSGTWVRYIDITDAEGVMQERGDIAVSGMPMGRFHMDEYGSTFRIVTFSGRWSGTNLHVIDVSDPDDLRVTGSINYLAPDEDLHATRFVGDMAYIVTYEPVILNTDPLWVVSLADPAHPTLLGRLEIPGWSDYIFPRGDQLLAVGRGDRGARVAASLFDVSDPTRSAERRRVEFGSEEAPSEANTDFRGVRIVESGVLGDTPFLAVPWTNNQWTSGSCQPSHFLQLVDILDDDLDLRGAAAQDGLIRRAVPIGNRLYAITDRSVAAVNVADRDVPYNAVSMEVGDPSAPDLCTSNDFSIDPDVWTDDDTGYSYFPFGCSLADTRAAGTGALPIAMALAALALAALSMRRR